MHNSQSITCTSLLAYALFLLMMVSLPVTSTAREQTAATLPSSLTAPPEQRLLPLRHAVNARDLGGYATADGRSVKWGVFYRSDSNAALDAQDVDLLRQLQLSVVTDFRSAQEKEGAQDRLPQQSPAIVYRTVAVNNPVLDVAELGRRVYAGDITNAELLALLDRRAYVTDPALRASWGNWLRSLSEPGALPQLFHCTAGKDRTGFAAAIALLAVGVPRATAMDDFLLSNQFLAERITEGTARIQANTTAELDPDVLAQVIGVSASSLEGAFAEMEARYGSVEGYIRDGLGIDEAIQVAAITVAADHHLTTAADTIVETSTVLHRHNPSEKNCAGTGREPATARYCAADRV